MRATIELAAVLVVMPVAKAAAQPDATARVDSIFAEWDAPDRPGAVVAVLKDGEIVLERGYGSAQLEYGIPITPATVFHVASVTKQFTAAGVVLLAERGVLSLDDDIRRHLPELPELGHTVTIRQLVHHTSGIRDQWELLAMGGWRLDDVITKEDILRMMWRQRELNFEPGSEHLYSNMGYTLLAEIVERAGGKPFPEWMAANVFVPLGMTSTHMHDDHQHVVPNRAYSYRRDGDGWRNAVLSYANAGATSLFTTAGDLARWLRNYETGEVGGPGFAAQMRERGVLTNGDTIGYAFAIARGEQRGSETWSHGGGDAGFRSFVLHLPERRLGVVVLSNDASFNPGRLAAAVADVYLGAPAAVAEESEEEGSAEPVPSVTVSPALLDAYAGLYEVPQIGFVRLIRDEGTLRVEGGGARFRLTAESDSTFRATAPPVRIRMVREGGVVAGLVVTQGGDEVGGTRLEESAVASDFAQYVGTYYSPELETVYRMEVTGDTLVARHRRTADIALQQIGRDRFRGGQWFFRDVVFTRTESGQVDGFRLTGGRVRNLRFVRLPGEVLPR